ncbi:ATP-grasp fold amidoligase family protein [Modestobacter lacusdianchii]
MMFPQLRPQITRLVPVSLRRRVWYRRRFHRALRLSDPQTFNEKVNWRIIKDRRPLLEGTCDKLTMKERAEAAGSFGLRVPRTYWVGTDVTELADVELPDRWVLKPNHSTARVHLGHGRPDLADLVERTRGWTEQQHWRVTGEWAYRSARPCLLVEEFIGEPGKVPDDYKVLVFDGVPRLVEVHTGRFSAHRAFPYTPDWEPLVAGDTAVPRPERLADMLASAEALSAGFDMMRVDFYEVDGELWFGELSPYAGSGLLSRIGEYDGLLGSWWRLPELPSRFERARAGLAGAVARRTRR